MQNKDIKNQYDKIGKDYISGQREFFSKRKDLAIKFIIKSMPDLKGKNILDFGCGSGNDIKRYEKMGAKNIYGIDTSEFMVLEARKKVKTPNNIFVSDIQKTDFKDNYFDIVVGRFSFHYLRHFNLAYKEIARILKKEGVLIIICQHPFKDLTMQQNKKYGKKDVVKLELYRNKVSVYFLTHTLKEYFSKDFFKFFYLDDFEEGVSPEEGHNVFRLPEFIGIKAKKR